MVFFRLLFLSPPLLLLFSTLVNSLESTQQLLDTVDTGYSQDSNDTVMEGSGGEGSGFTLNDDDVTPTLTLDKSTVSTTPSVDIGSPRSRFLSVIDKRATDPTNHKLGSLPNDFLGKMDLSRGIPPDALMAMGRPLKKRNGITSTEYVVVSLQSTSRLWGRLYRDSSGTLQAEFVENNRKVDARTQSRSFRVILLPSNAASTYNVDVQWVQGRLVDPLSIVVQVDTRRNYAKTTAGVLVSADQEFLGEADVENRRFTYIENGNVVIVEGARFDESVFVMTKASCSCSCQSRGGSIFANIKDFFG